MAKRSKSTKPKHGVVSPLNSSVMATGKGDYNEANDNDGHHATTHKNNRQSKKKDSNNHRGSETTSSRSNNNGKKRREMSETKLSEEAALTSLLFGGGGSAPMGGGLGATTAAWMDDDDALVESNKQEEEEEDSNTGEERSNNNARYDDDGELFAIDRSGEEVTTTTDDVVEEEDDGDVSHDDSDDDSDDGDEESMVDEVDNEQDKVSMSKAAWQDSESEDSSSDSESDESDDDNDDDDDVVNHRKSKKQKKGISLVDGSNRLKKLRRYRDETDPLSFKEYELRLRERFINTASVAARTDWADVGGLVAQQQEEEPQLKKKKKKGGYASSSTEDESSDDDDEYGNTAKNILESNASLFATSSNGLQLPPTLLNVVRTRDGNLTDPNNSVVSATQFHPGSSDQDNPLLMTAGMDKMVRFFRVDGDTNPKIHGIHFPKMPITCASFLGDSGSVVLSGRRPFFYVYDAVSGNIQKIPSIVGRGERSLEKFTVSPDGRVIAFVGNDGYVILVDGKTRQWIGDLKMNGSVRAITFSEDGEYVIGSGSDGDVYRWHIGSRRCVERFHNEDGTITSSLAVSSNFLAVGAESGVVNLYNDKHAPSSARGRGGLSLTATERSPLKSIMNMTTSADNVCFNHDGQILAMSTRRETNGLKLLHVPTATVFSNWPTSKTPLKYVWSMDFSPGSKYLAVGNDHGKCLLYRLKHYWDE